MIMIRKIHAGQVFRCAICDNDFQSARRLKDHARKMHGTEEKQCQECKKVFSAISSLRRHVKTIHK